MRVRISILTVAMLAVLNFAKAAQAVPFVLDDATGAVYSPTWDIAVSPAAGDNGGSGNWDANGWRADHFNYPGTAISDYVIANNPTFGPSFYRSATSNGSIERFFSSTMAIGDTLEFDFDTNANVNNGRAELYFGQAASSWHFGINTGSDTYHLGAVNTLIAGGPVHVLAKVVAGGAFDSLDVTVTPYPSGTPFNTTIAMTAPLNGFFYQVGLGSGGIESYLRFAEEESAVPEPSTLALGLLGLIGVGACVLRRKLPCSSLSGKVGK